MAASLTGPRTEPAAGVRRWARRARAFYGSYLALLVLGAIVAAATHGAATQRVYGPGIVLFCAVGLALAGRAATHRQLARRTRVAWSVVSVSFVQLLAVPLLFIVSPQVSFPTPGDLAKLSSMPTLLVALLTFPLRTTSRRERQKIALDVATVVGGCAMVLWYFVIGPQLSHAGTSMGSVIAASAFPVGDLALIFGLATVQLRGADRSARRSLSLIGLAISCFVLNDVYIGYVQSHPQSADGNGWQFLCLMTAHFLLAAAALEQCRQAGGDSLERDFGPRLRTASRLPYAAVGLGYALMVAAAVAERNAYPWAGLVMGGATVTALVVVRQLMVQRESHELAVTDALTGLANRDRLHDTLVRALARGQRQQQVTAAMLVDMDGFKRVNDTMGHKAGDRLLVAFAELLRRNVLGADLVGRLGGDEFAVVLHDIGDAGNAEAVARRILADMQQPVLIDGTLVAPRASFGIALAAPGELNPDELLHRADIAMYQVKRSGATVAVYRDGSSDAAGSPAAAGSPDAARSGAEVAPVAAARLR